MSKQVHVLFLGEHHPGRIYGTSARALQAMEDMKKTLPKYKAKTMYIEKFDCGKEAAKVLVTRRKELEKIKLEAKKKKSLKNGSHQEQLQQVQNAATLSPRESQSSCAKKRLAPDHEEKPLQKRKKKNSDQGETITTVDNNCLSAQAKPPKAENNLVARVEPSIKEIIAPDLKTIKASMEELKKTQADVEEEVAICVNQVRTSTAYMVTIKEQIAAVENRTSKLEARKTKYLLDAINLIAIKAKSRVQEQASKSMPTSTDHNSVDMTAKHNVEAHEKTVTDFSYDDDGYCIVFTNALASEQQGKLIAGLGVFFGDGNKYNMSEPIQDFLEANNMDRKPTIVNLLAATLACNVANLLGIPKIHIHSSCKTMLKRIKKNLPIWKENGWIWEEYNNRPVNPSLKDTLQRLMISTKDLKVKWTLVKPQNYENSSRVSGNAMSERLAIEAAEKCLKR
ncbi:Hypothetical predicted protein [Cloeon dipterum]|uniref:RNase H type-1 domain-containing protein n=1 Tax=Cloeon dipterum TaxID=197152 RepID=A0A8S1CYZ7_9INSE|nr:Hypothetical predicted protein [Cloeon dipterum]